MSLAVPVSRAGTSSAAPSSAAPALTESGDPTQSNTLPLPTVGGGAAHSAVVSRDTEDYNRILNTIGKPNYSTIRDLFVKGGSMPSDTVPAIQISFELFETVQNRFAATKQTLERTKEELRNRNQQHTEVLLQLRNLKEDYKQMEKRAQDAEESNRELRMHSAKLDGTIEQLRKEGAQMRTDMESVQEKLLVQEDRLHNAQNRVAEALVTISQKEAGITALRRELGKFLRYRNSSRGEEDPEDVLRNIAADVESRAKEVRNKLGVAQLQEALQKVEQESSYLLQQHSKYVQHVQKMIGAYETQAMELEDGFASHKCVKTPYYLTSEFYKELMHPDAFAAKASEEDALRSLPEPPSADPGPSAPHKTFRSLTFEFQRALDRMKKIDIDPASRLREEVNTCVQAHAQTMNMGAQLVSFLSTWEAELTHTKLSMQELKEEWVKAQVPFFVTKVAQGLADGVTAFSTGLVHLLHRENEITALIREYETNPPLLSCNSTMDVPGSPELRRSPVQHLSMENSSNLGSPSGRRRRGTNHAVENQRRSTVCRGDSAHTDDEVEDKHLPVDKSSSGSFLEPRISHNASHHGLFDRSVSAMSALHGVEGETQTSHGFSPDLVGVPEPYSKPAPICSVCRKAMRPDSVEIITETDQFKHTLNPEVAEEVRHIVTKEDSTGRKPAGEDLSEESSSGFLGGGHESEEYVPILDENGQPLTARRNSVHWADALSGAGNSASQSARQSASQSAIQSAIHSASQSASQSLSGDAWSARKQTTPSARGSSSDRGDRSNSEHDSTPPRIYMESIGTSPIGEYRRSSVGSVGSPVLRVLPPEDLRDTSSQLSLVNPMNSAASNESSVSARSSYLARPEVRTLVDKYEAGLRTRERELGHLRTITEKIADVVAVSSTEGWKSDEVLATISDLLQNMMERPKSILNETMPPQPRLSFANETAPLPPLHGAQGPRQSMSSSSRHSMSASPSHPRDRGPKKKPRMSQGTVDRLHKNTPRREPRLPPMASAAPPYITDEYPQMTSAPMGIGGMRMGVSVPAKPSMSPRQTTFKRNIDKADAEMREQHAALLRNARRRVPHRPSVASKALSELPLTGVAHTQSSSAHGTPTISQEAFPRDRVLGQSSPDSAQHSLNSQSQLLGQPFTAFRRTSHAEGGGGVYVGGEEFMAYHHDGRRADWLPRAGYGSLHRSSDETGFALDHSPKSQPEMNSSWSRRVSQTHVNQITLGGVEQPPVGAYVRIDKRASWMQHLLQQQQIQRMSQLQNWHRQSHPPSHGNAMQSYLEHDAPEFFSGALRIGGVNPLQRNPQRTVPPASGQLRRWSDNRSRPKGMQSGLRRSSYLTLHKQHRNNGLLNANPLLFEMQPEMRHQQQFGVVRGRPQPPLNLQAKRDARMPLIKQNTHIRYVPVQRTGGPAARGNGIFPNFDTPSNLFLLQGSHRGAGGTRGGRPLLRQLGHGTVGGGPLMMFGDRESRGGGGMSGVLHTHRIG